MKPLLSILLAFAFTGCATPVTPGGRVAVEAHDYQRSFDAAREVLIDMGFTLDRIDAPAGVITTSPLRGQGLAAPWERHQADLSAEVADTFHLQSRTVRIEFVPASTFGSIASDRARSQIDPGQAPPAVATDRPTVAAVTVLIERNYRPGLRPQVTDVLYSSRARDPALDRSGAGRSFDVVIARDPELEDIIAGRLAHALGYGRLPADRR